MVARHRRALVVTWGTGGNVPPLFGVAQLLVDRGIAVDVVASVGTRAAAIRSGLPTHAYRRAPAPDDSVPFEAQAQRLLASAAGFEVACDVMELVRELAVDLLVVDCMLPAALAAGEAAGVPTVSVVHTPYVPMRSVMVGGGTVMTDQVTLDATRRQLGLAVTGGALGAWESPELLLVTLPRWFDAPGELPEHVVHAGPLGLRIPSARVERSRGARALVAFSTTVMEGQQQLVETVCAAVEQVGVTAVVTLGGVQRQSVAAGVAGVEVVEWADHDDLLGRCDVVITHGGLGTTLRALAHGRPLLMMPLGRDQHFNAARVEALGAGFQLSATTSPGEIAHALERLLTESDYRAAARRAAATIAAERPDEVAAAALTGLVATP